MRNSKQRNLILDIVNQSTSHPTAEEIYIECRKQFSNISLGTVYRNLNLLVELNEIIKVEGVDDKEHFDKKIEHYHFVCNSCKKIIDIYGIEMPKYQEINGHKIDEQILTFKGICNSCQK